MPVSVISKLEINAIAFAQALGMNTLRLTDNHKNFLTGGHDS